MARDTVTVPSPDPDDERPHVDAGPEATPPVDGPAVEPQPEDDPRTVKVLKAALVERGLSAKGSKAELIARLDAPAAPTDAPPSIDPEAGATEAPATETAPLPTDTGLGVVVVATIFIWRDDTGSKRRARKGDVLTGVPQEAVDRGLAHGTLAYAE